MKSFNNPFLRCAATLSFCCPLMLLAQKQPAALTVPLLVPSGLAYDAAGDLIFAEAAAHKIRMVTPAGEITTIAGTGTQGFSGDGGLAVNADLDTPTAVAVSANGAVVFADSHNHRVRQIDALSGIMTTLVGPGILDLPTALAFNAAGDLFVADAKRHVIVKVDRINGATSTVAGNGTQGRSADGVPALDAVMDTPLGLAVSSAGDVYFAEGHNNRVRKIDHSTGMLTTVAGIGLVGFGGDGAAASGASLMLPRGLALDATGDLYVVDAGNQRVRRVDAQTATIATVVGDGAQGFLLDGVAATGASLDSPHAVALAGGLQLPTVTDTGNRRVRQVDAAGLISTVAGLGATGAQRLILAGPSVTQYGSGTIVATLIASPAAGVVNFFDGQRALGTAVLAANTAVLPLGGLGAGNHGISATYAGDATHGAAASLVIAVTVVAAPVEVSVSGPTVAYGLAIPVLDGVLNGVLAGDLGTVRVNLGSSAVLGVSPGSYPIFGVLTGVKAGNYSLAPIAAVVIVEKAAARVGLAAVSGGFELRVVSSTSGAPGGAVELRDGGGVVGVATLSAAGVAEFSSAGLTGGSHTLTAAYGGDLNFSGATSAPLVVTTGPKAVADFTVAVSTAADVSVSAGGKAVYGFVVMPVGGVFSSPLVLSVSGLPAGVTASFDPGYLPPPVGPAAFLLTVQTSKTVAGFRAGVLVFALLVGMFVGRRRRVALLGLVVLTGCGDRVVHSNVSSSARTYNLTVSVTGTGAGGAAIVHSVPLTLTVQ